MRLTQRNLTEKSVLPLSLLFGATSPVIARQDVDIVASIKNSTCQSEISNNGNIDLGVVGVGGFTRDISAEDYHPGGKEFTITVQNCALQGTGSVLNQLHINFRVLSSVMATGSGQIFANEDSAGAKNVGVVIFSIQDPANTFNVLSATGSSRSIHPAMSLALNNSSWEFNTRMQKISPALNVTSDPLISHVLVDIYYEQQTKCCKHHLAV